MRRILSRILLGLCFLLPAGVVCDSGPAPQAKEHLRGYARVVIDRQTKGRPGTCYDVRLWFDGARRYRIEGRRENRDGRTDGYVNYIVRDGKYAYQAYARQDGCREPPWFCEPDYLGDGRTTLDLYLHWGSHLIRSKPVGYETILGMRTKHLQGPSKGTKSVNYKDVWISTDPRFPHPLRVDTRSSNATVSWRIIELDLKRPLPGYLFIPQTHPKPGVLNLLKLRYKPPLQAVAFRFALLLSYGVAIAGIAPCHKPAGRARRGLLVIVSTAAVAILLAWSAKPEVYLYTVNGTPIIAAYAVLTALWMAALVRLVGSPGSLLTFRGTTPALIALVVLAGLIGGLSRYTVFVSLTRAIELPGSLVRLMPVVLLNTALYTAASAAVEEVVFRGYVLQALLDRIRSVGFALTVQAILFALYHVPGSLHQVSSARVIGILIWTFLYGIAFGVLRLRYRNLGVPWLVHFALNFAGFFVFCSACASIPDMLSKL